MPATFSWEREWLREASLHELSARALCDVALPGVAAAKQHFVTTTKSPTSPRSPPVVVKPVTLQFSTRRPLDFGAAARAGRSPANDAQALQRQLAAAGLSPGRLHMLRRAAGSPRARARAAADDVADALGEHAARPAAVAREGRPPSTCLSGTPPAERPAAAGPAARRRIGAHSPGGGGPRPPRRRARRAPRGARRDRRRRCRRRRAPAAAGVAVAAHTEPAAGVAVCVVALAADAEPATVAAATQAALAAEDARRLPVARRGGQRRAASRQCAEPARARRRRLLVGADRRGGRERAARCRGLMRVE